MSKKQLENFEVVNAWLSLIGEATKCDDPPPKISVEVPCGGSYIDVLITHHNGFCVWICELKRANLDIEQAKKLLNLGKDQLINYGIIDKLMNYEHMVVFVLGNTQKALCAVENVKELNNFRTEYEIIGLELDDLRNVKAYLIRGTLVPTVISEKIKEIKSRYRRFFPVLVDESTLRSNSREEASQIDKWLSTAFFTVVSKEYVANFSWDDIERELKKSWGFFDFSNKINNLLIKRFKRNIVRTFINKKAIEYDKNNNVWIIKDRSKILNLANIKSIFAKNISRGDSQLSFLDET